jgi:hypothetical protein
MVTADAFAICYASLGSISAAAMTTVVEIIRGFFEVVDNGLGAAGGCWID